MVPFASAQVGPLYAARMHRFALVIALSLLPASVVAQPTMNGLGEQHYQAGVDAYAHRDFARAAVEFRAAYELTQVPALLFNLGNALAADSQRDAAVEAYRAYLREIPDAPNRADIESRLRALGELGPVATPPPPRDVTPPPPREVTPPPRDVTQPPREVAPPPRVTRRSPLSLAGGVVGAAGLVAVGVGVGLYVDVLNTFESCQRAPCLEAQQPRGEYAASLGLMIGGGALAVGGIVTMLLAPRVTRDAERAPYVMVHPNGVVVGGAF